MGECGCQSIDSGRVKFGDVWLIIGVYPGCEECARIVAVDFKVTPDKNMIHDGWYKHLPDWTDRFKDEYGMALPVLTLNNIISSFNEEMINPSEYDSPGEYMSDCFLPIRESVFKTHKEFADTGRVKD